VIVHDEYSLQDYRKISISNAGKIMTYMEKCCPQVIKEEGRDVY
jgi:hypothetical protein